MLKKGSLVLGNKATAPGQDPDKETKKYRRDWKVQVDKVSRYMDELDEAVELWDSVQTDYSPAQYKELKRQKENEARKK